MKRYENGIHAGELKRRNGLEVSEVKGLEGDIMQCYFHLDEWEKFCWKGWEDKKRQNVSDKEEYSEGRRNRRLIIRE